MGIFFGAALVSLLNQHSPCGASDLPLIRHWRERSSSPQRVLKRFSRRLDLDSEQQQQLRQILEKSRKLYRSANKRTRGLYRGIRQSTLQEIRAILRPEQTRKLEEFVKQKDKRWQKRRRKTDVE